MQSINSAEFIGTLKCHPYFEASGVIGILRQQSNIKYDIYPCSEFQIRAGGPDLELFFIK